MNKVFRLPSLSAKILLGFFISASFLLMSQQPVFAAVTCGFNTPNPATKTIQLYLYNATAIPKGSGVIIGLVDQTANTSLLVDFSLQNECVSPDSCTSAALDYSQVPAQINPSHTYVVEAEYDPTPGNSGNGDTKVLCTQTANVQQLIGPVQPPPVNPPAGGQPPAAHPPVQAPGTNSLNPTDAVSNSTFDALNPLKNSGDSTTAKELSTPGGVIGRVLRFAFPIAGLILFVMIVMGGFQMLMGASDKKSLDAGKQRVTAALMGFLLLFASYWIMQIVQVIFGVKAL